MRIERFDDTASFFARAETFLAKREAEHNLMLGLRSGLEEDPHRFGPEDPVLLAALEGDVVVAAAVQTPPFRLVLSEIDDLAYAEAFAEAAADEPLPGVLGPKAAARRFADAWARLTGATASVELEERIYAASAIAPPRGVAGHMRAYAVSDRETAIRWLQAFFDEATPGGPGAAGEDFLRRREAATDEGLVLWDDGGAVSIAGFGSPTPNGIRIGPVYTPPDLRGRGYASALTAAVSVEQLRTRRFCFLFTDLANPTSNSIYRRIGYEPVTDVTMMSF
jgi:uncharacterized protein